VPFKTVQEEFFGDDVDIACCEFHWKQPLRRNFLQFGLPTKYVSEMIGDGGTMEILTYIPIEEIICKGVPYGRSISDEHPYESI
jgi:hypothetical protein